VIEHQVAARLDGEVDPALPRANRLAVRDDQPVELLAGENARKVPGSRPLAKITFSPVAVAMGAATSLLAMPPLLIPVRRWRTRAKR
jgi:hypothetical protein